MKAVRNLSAYLVLASSLFSPKVLADDQNPPLQPGYFKIQPLEDINFNRDLERQHRNRYNFPTKSLVSDMIAKQSSVKSQGSRGTCSIFSSTALLEYLMMQRQHMSSDLNLSEQWLAYLAFREQSYEGSSSSRNLMLFSSYGYVSEANLPYNPTAWKSINTSEDSVRTCGRLPDPSKAASCLVAQRNPDLLLVSDQDLANSSSYYYDPIFLKARQEARASMQYLPQAQSEDAYMVRSYYDIRSYLARSIPVVADLNVYYGAWNHGLGKNLGIPINPEYWRLGVVGYPEPGSIDRERSPQQPVAHSILIVAYDDDVTLNITQMDPYGRQVTYSYRGAYIFKNSWGTNGFGRDFEYQGVKYPGYGYLPYQYAHEFGQFYHYDM